MQYAAAFLLPSIAGKVIDVAVAVFIKKTKWFYWTLVQYRPVRTTPRKIGAWPPHNPWRQFVPHSISLIEDRLVHIHDEQKAGGDGKVNSLCMKSMTSTRKWRPPVLHGNPKFSTKGRGRDTAYHQAVTMTAGTAISTLVLRSEALFRGLEGPGEGRQDPVHCWEGLSQPPRQIGARN